MTKIPFIHYHKDQNSLIKIYYFVLIPLLIFGFYKNGILLYQSNLIHFKDLFIPIYFYISSILIAFIASHILKEKKSEMILYAITLSACTSINSNILVYSIVLLIGLFFIHYLKQIKKINFNYLTAIHFLLLLSVMLGTYSYLNIAETLNTFHYNLFDIFLGFGIGGLASTSLLLVLCAFCFLSLNPFYKKGIPIFASLTYFIILLLLFMITNNYNYLLYLCNGHTYFIFIFIAPLLKSTLNYPLTSKIGGILIGVLSVLGTISGFFFEAAFLAIFLESILEPFINKRINKKYLQV